MNAISIIGGAFCFFVAAICMMLAVASARDGIDFAKENDAGAALVCFGMTFIIGGVAPLLVILAVELIGG